MGRRNIMVERLEKHIFFALPAKSYADIAERTGLTVAQVASAFVFLRKHPEALEWTIAHGRRGRTSDQDRFHCQLLDKKSGKLECDPGAEKHVIDGETSTLRTQVSFNRTQAPALRCMAARYSDQPMIKRALRTLARERENDSERLEELITMIEEVRGKSFGA